MKRTIIIKDPERSPPVRAWGFRAALTFACAFAADGLQWVIPFLWPVFDGGMVLAILVIWGWRWEVLIVVIPELVPGVELAPTWTLFAVYLLITSRREATKISDLPPTTEKPDPRRVN